MFHITIYYKLLVWQIPWLASIMIDAAQGVGSLAFIIGWTEV